MVYFLILSEKRLLSGACLRWISPPCVTVAAKKERERERARKAGRVWCGSLKLLCRHWVLMFTTLVSRLTDIYLSASSWRYRHCMHAYVHYICAYTCIACLLNLPFVMSKRQVEEDGGQCNSEWASLRWRDKIRIDRPINAPLQKTAEREKREGGRRGEEWREVEIKRGGSGRQRETKRGADVERADEEERRRDGNNR